MLTFHSNIKKIRVLFYLTKQELNNLLCIWIIKIRNGSKYIDLLYICGVFYKAIKEITYARERNRESIPGADDNSLFGTVYPDTSYPEG